MQSEEALADWQWLEKEVLPGLGAFDDPAECVEYVAVKVKKLSARKQSICNCVFLNKFVWHD